MPYPHVNPQAPIVSARDQRFTKTCTGSETDTFNVTLPAPRPDTNYAALVTLISSSTNAQYLCNAPPSGYTTTQIQVLAGVPPSAGDILLIEVLEKTS